MRKPAPQKRPSLKASVTSLRKYADSFEGLTIREVRNKLSSGKIKMTDWDQGKQLQDKQLVATFPDHEVRVFFYGGKALVTSVQILSR